MAPNPPELNHLESEIRQTGVEMESEHTRARREEDELVQAVKASLQQIITESTQLQADQYEKSRDYFSQKWRQIEKIHQLIQSKYSNSDDPRVTEIREVLSALMLLLKQKQQTIEKELLDEREEKQRELSAIAHSAEESRKRVSTRHASEIAEEFSGILHEVQVHQSQMRERFEELVTTEREAFNNILSQVQERYKILRQTQQKEAQDSRVMVKEKMEFCHQHIRMGEVVQAVRAQKELISFLHDRQAQFKQKANDTSLANMESLTHFDTTTQQDTESWLAQNQSVFEEVRKVLAQQGEEAQRILDEECEKETEEQINAFHAAQRDSQERFCEEYQERLSTMKSRIIRQTEDNQRRRKQAYEDIINQTRLQVAELEKRAEYRQQRLLEEQQVMLASAAQEVDGFNRRGEKLGVELTSMQQTLVATQDKRTRDLISEVKKSARNQAWEEKLRIGKDTFARAMALKDKQAESARDAFDQMIAEGTAILEQMQECRERYKAIVRQEKIDIRDMRERHAARQKECEAQHQQRVSAAKRIFAEEEGRLQARQAAIQAEQKRFQGLLNNPFSPENTPTGEEMVENIEEFKEMVSKALAKRQAEHERLTENLRLARKKYEQAFEESIERLKTEETEISVEQTKEFTRIQQEAKEECELLKKEEHILSQQHEALKRSLSERHDEARQLFKEEEQRMYAETQSKLQELEAELLDLNISPTAEE